MQLRIGSSHLRLRERALQGSSGEEDDNDITIPILLRFLERDAQFSPTHVLPSCSEAANPLLVS